MSITVDAPRTALRTSGRPAPYRSAPRYDPLSAEHIRQNGLSPASAAVRRSAARAAALSEAGREAVDGALAPHRERRARGLVLYVGIDEEAALAAGTSLVDIATALRARLAELVPEAETSASIALAPATTELTDLQAVRAALGGGARTGRPVRSEPAVPDHGVVVDLARREVHADGTSVGLTYKEFELLRQLVTEPGRTVSRQELIAKVWAGADEDEVPNERTVDVHVRRLRAKLGDYTSIVRTVRGVGYRFDEHPDVAVVTSEPHRADHVAAVRRGLAPRRGHGAAGPSPYRDDEVRQGLGPRVRTGEGITPRYGYGPARRSY